MSDQIAHVVIQVAEATSPATAEIAHQVIQVAQLTEPATRIAHLVMQVVQGNAPITTDIPGLLFPNPNSTHDSYGDVNRKIPNPTIRTALLGE